jgi:CMP-N,N'-diacetyllegionaminic acid synthase
MEQLEAFGKNILALVPARGGSQRIKEKNIQLLGGKPLISYTIEAALKSRYLDRVLVSTDSEAIAEVARQCGADVPFLRPAGISGASATEFEFHSHALNWVRTHEGINPEWILNLYPTTPFRKSSTIDRAIELALQHPTADALRSLRKVSEHPYKMWEISGEFAAPYEASADRNIHTAAYHTLPPVYIQNASIYMVRSRVIDEFRSTIGDRTVALEMTDEESVDINSPIDFEFAEFLLARQFVSGKHSHSQQTAEEPLC